MGAENWERSHLLCLWAKPPLSLSEEWVERSGKAVEGKRHEMTWAEWGTHLP